MDDDRITETHTTDPQGNTHTTVTRDSHRTDGSGGGGGKVLMLLILVAVVAVAIWFFTQQSGAEIAKDNAMADAATEVGEAAGAVGEAAQNAGDAVQDTVNGE